MRKNGFEVQRQSDAADRARRTALYLRHSAAEAESAEAHAHQERHLRDYTQERGWTVAGVYSYFGSGVGRERPSLAKLIADALEGKFDVILSMDLWLLLRGTDFALELREELMSGKVHVVTLDGMVNTFACSGLMVGFYDWVYGQEELRGQQ